MTNEELTLLLGGWEGYCLATAERRAATQEGERPEIWLTLDAEPARVKRCSGCGEVVQAVHDGEERLIRDLPILDADTWLRLKRYRLACPRCGPKLEQLRWLGRYARVTRRLAESVARLCRELPIKHVAEHYDLHWSTVKAIDHAYLEAKLGPINLTGIEQIAMDEFAIQKGHRYATVVVEPHTKRVLWVGRGRKREDVRPFFACGARKRRPSMSIWLVSPSKATSSITC